MLDHRNRRRLFPARPMNATAHRSSTNPALKPGSFAVAAGLMVVAVAIKNILAAHQAP